MHALRMTQYVEKHDRMLSFIMFCIFSGCSAPLTKMPVLFSPHDFTINTSMFIVLFLAFVGNFLHKQNLRLMKDGASQAAVRVKLEWKKVDAMDEKQLLDAWQVPSAQMKGSEEKKEEATTKQQPSKTKKTGKIEIKKRWKICQRLNFNTYEHSYKHVYILIQGIHRGNIHGGPARSAFGSNDPNRGKLSHSTVTLLKRAVPPQTRKWCY